MARSKRAASDHPIKRTVLELGIWKNRRDGTVVYVVPGHPPDTWESLERDGLIRRQYNSNGNHIETLVFKQDDLRVIAFQLTMNARCQQIGKRPIFDGLSDAFDVFPYEPQGTA
jgi:hypothetical protein